MASAGEDNLTRRLRCDAARGSIDQGLAQLGIHIVVCMGHLLFKMSANSTKRAALAGGSAGWSKRRL